MLVRLYDDSGEWIWTGTLAEFARDNEMCEDDTADIRAELLCTGTFCGGGGAAPEYRLGLVRG